MNLPGSSRMENSNIVLVTGASGYTGGYVVRHLLGQGKRVRAMIRNRSLARDLERLGAQVVLANLKDSASIEAAVHGVDSIVHVAALFRQAGLPENEYFNVNLEGTRYLLDAAERSGVKRFIHCSTVGVLGHIANPPANEESPYQPGDVYQRSKTAAEELVLSYFRANRLRGLVIRPAMIYGPNDTRTFKIFKMIARRRFCYVGRGMEFVHFVDVRDLAAAFSLALQNDHLHNRIYIIAGREAMPLKEFADRVSLVMNVSPPWLHLPISPLRVLGSVCEKICIPLRIQPPIYRRRVDFFTKSRHFDGTRAKDELGFSPTQDSYGELVDIVNSYIESGALCGPALSLPCRIVRNKEGRVSAWDEQAAKFYGLSQTEAVGKVTHSLLRTKFPHPVAEINRILDQKGQWIGNLKHFTKSGDLLHVFSRWSLNKKFADSGGVLEENRIRIMPAGTGGCSRLAANAFGPLACWCDQIGVLAESAL